MSTASPWCAGWSSPAVTRGAACTCCPTCTTPRTPRCSPRRTGSVPRVPDRAHAMVDLLSRDYPLTWADVEEQTGADATVGRPHIADALVALGVVPDRSAAFADILATGSPYCVPHHAIRLVDAIPLVLAAGGVPVLAHPGAADRGRAVSEAEVALLARHGPGRARGLPPGQPAGRAGPAGRARRPLRAADHRLERLPRRRQAEPARRAPDRPPHAASSSRAAGGWT